MAENQGVPKRFTLETKEAVIRLEYGDVWLSSMFFWLLTLVAAAGGALWGIDHKVMVVVVRERRTGKPVYKKGPFPGGDDATRSAQQIAAEIDKGGLDSFLRSASAA